LRAQSEGVGALYRRAFALYSEYFPKFVKLSLIAHVPMIITSLLLVGALPTWGYSSGWGYWPSGGLGLVLLVLIVLMLMGRL